MLGCVIWLTRLRGICIPTTLWMSPESTNICLLFLRGKMEDGGWRVEEVDIIPMLHLGVLVNEVVTDAISWHKHQKQEGGEHCERSETFD